MTVNLSFWKMRSDKNLADYNTKKTAMLLIKLN